jgi:hypothetical protein
MNCLFAIGAAMSLMVADHAWGAGAPPDQPEGRDAVTIGILQGGSLLGFDYDRLVADRVGLQFGAGLIGFDAGVTYHHRPGIRSRNLFLGFWNLGPPGGQANLRIVGLTHAWRSRQLFTTQLGIGATIRQSEESRDRFGEAPVLLIYSIGLCLKPRSAQSSD